MSADSLFRFDATELGARIATGELRTRSVVEALLNRISTLDRELRAWVHVDGPAALAEADELDREALAGRLRGPLHGVPVGVKDIYDVAGMPTRAGAKLLAGTGAAAVDSAPVAALRAAGALILGKTETTEFAYAQPAPTRNPWNLDYEPGGSSSGSGAAVAAGMVPVALGSQTAGSVLRPAAYCGVVGFKPSFGRIDRAGVIPFAWSLDTMGTLSCSVRDARLFLHTMTSPSWRTNGPASAGLLPRLAYVPRLLPERLDPRMSAALARAATTLERAGARVEEQALPADFAVALEAHHVIMVTEGAAYHAEGVAARPDGYSARLRQMADTGALVRGVDYLRAQRVRRDLFERVVSLFNRYDALLVPAAPGPAPLKRGDFTGDPAFNAPWTLFGLPAIALFGGLSDDGLPLGVQLVGPPGDDEGLLDIAEWCERALGPAPPPPPPSG